MSEVDPAAVAVIALLLVGAVLMWMRSVDTRRRQLVRSHLVRACRAGSLRSTVVVGDGVRPIVLAVRQPIDAGWLLSDQGHSAIRAVVGDVELTNRRDSRVEVG